MRALLEHHPAQLLLVDLLRFGRGQGRAHPDVGTLGDALIEVLQAERHELA